MGIQGLIPFLDKASTPTNVSKFSGTAAAIDAYCWLHKGVFSCADKLARGDACDSYVFYCMKLVNMLLSHNIKPILVFDGQKLPAKANTENKRRELREQNRKKAADLMRQDRGKEAQTYLRASIDVTHEMALNVIKACRARNVDCIVAPYEADAQLAYLNIQNIVEFIITEDSDLLLFGAKKVLFKMDINGNGLLIEHDKLHISMGVNPETFSFDKFRYMCILSGCDYLSSLPGIGLAKACRFITRTIDPDIYRAMSRLSFHLNMPQLIVSKEYKDSFMDADFMFKHQPVFDPVKQKLVPLTPLSENDDDHKKFIDLIAVNNLSEEQVRQLSYGNLNPFTLVQLDNWTPEALRSLKANPNDKFKSIAPHRSIWDENYTPGQTNPKPKATAPNSLSRTCPVKVKNSSSSPLESAKSDVLNPRITKQLEANQLKEFANIYCVKNNATVNNSGLLEDEDSLPQDTTQSSDVKSPEARKTGGALLKFAYSSKSSSGNETDKVLSRYFINQELQTEPKPTLSTPSSPCNEDARDCDLFTFLYSKRSPEPVSKTINETQRSPLKEINSDERDSSDDFITSESTDMKKRSNPFVVIKNDTITCKNTENDTEQNDTPKTKRKCVDLSSFRWKTDIKSRYFASQSSSQEEDTSKSRVDADSFMERYPGVDGEDQPYSSITEKSSTPRLKSPVLGKIRRSSNFDRKLKTSGSIMKSSGPKQMSLSAFIYSKPKLQI